MGENESFILGIVGISTSFFFVLMGWLQAWILFGVFIIAGLLYGTRFFATGITGGFGAGVFASPGLGWIPIWMYFTAIVISTVLLAVKIAGMYVNTGQNK